MIPCLSLPGGGPKGAPVFLLSSSVFSWQQPCGVGSVGRGEWPKAPRLESGRRHPTPPHKRDRGGSGSLSGIIGGLSQSIIMPIVYQSIIIPIYANSIYYTKVAVSHFPTRVQTDKSLKEVQQFPWGKCKRVQIVKTPQGRPSVSPSISKCLEQKSSKPLLQVNLNNYL